MNPVYVKLALHKNRVIWVLENVKWTLHKIEDDAKQIADFKLKTKELATKFFIIESVVGKTDSFVTEKFHLVLNDFFKLSKSEQNVFLRKIANT